MGSNKPNTAKKSIYSCLFPVYGVQVGSELRGGLRVGDVRIVNAASVKRSPQNYGISKLATKLKAGFEEDFFENAQTVAHLNWPREFGSRSTAAEEKKVREALQIVAGFSLGFVNRGDIRLSLEPLREKGFTRFVMFDTNSDAWKTHTRAGRPRVPFRLDKRWKSNADIYGFSDFLRILERRVVVHRGWRKDLCRAVILAGQSLLASRRQEAFLLNMIALETLLTRSSLLKNSRIVRTC